MHNNFKSCAYAMIGGKKRITEPIMLMTKRLRMAMSALIAVLLVMAVAAGCTSGVNNKVRI